MIFTPPAPYTSTLWSNRTVGLLGGSFNPAHEGHRHISLQALKHLGLDAVWWMVSPQNPLKPAKGMAPLAARVASARAAARHPKIFVTDIETRLDTRFTADTLLKLKALYPATRFVWLMGLDNLHQVHKWKRWTEIFESLPVCVVDRPMADGRVRGCAAMEKFHKRLVSPEKSASLARMQTPAWTILRGPLNGISSTKIRGGGKKPPLPHTCGRGLG